MVQASPLAFRFAAGGKRFGTSAAASSGPSATHAAMTRRPSTTTTRTSTIRCTASATAAADAMKSEEAGNAKRAAESKAAGVQGEEKRAPRGGDPPPQGGKWGWTLNWDPIVFDDLSEPIPDPTEAQLAATQLIIGSCPRSPADIDRLVDEAGVQAIICLQCTLCHGALAIDWAGDTRGPIPPCTRPHFSAQPERLSVFCWMSGG
jgi:hypothetical protein